MRKIRPGEITPEHAYVNRRQLIRGVCAVLASSTLAACAQETGQQGHANEPTSGPRDAAEPLTGPTNPVGATPFATAVTDDKGNQLSSYAAITGANNYYEFSVGKAQVATVARDFQTSPWQVEVGGLVSKPRILDLEDLLEFDQEERIYRMRCVEGWSMVIPWIGFPLWRLLEEVEPTSEARYVRFETIYAPDVMPGQHSSYPWPYVEGLRLDEAMHDLTILATGLYGKSLPPQNGAPIRLVVPWKYGFKSIKSIVKIDLVAEMPVSLWMSLFPDVYGFYANVNPDVAHPRWSQAFERRIGSDQGRIRTLLFNGYEEEVASLYADMDLAKFF